MASWRCRWRIADALVNLDDELEGRGREVVDVPADLHDARGKLVAFRKAKCSPPEIPPRLKE
jgi:hypothetical protein